MLPAAFLGHGTFIYRAAETLAKFGNSGSRFSAALQRAGMGHAWIRLHDYELTEEPEAPTRAFINLLREAGITLAGWGFNSGWDPVTDAQKVAKLVRKYDLTHYVADIEQDEHGSRWTASKVITFLTELRLRLPADAKVLVSSYPYIKGKHPHLMRAAVPLVDGFAPQIYWHDYPNQNMLTPANLPPKRSRPYGPHDLHSPEAYAELCLDWWREFVGDKPLILTGQAYWERGFKREAAEAKLDRFLTTFTSWHRVCAVNWWHLGHATSTNSNGAMSPAMFDAIVKANLANKPLAKSAPTS